MHKFYFCTFDNTKFHVPENYVFCKFGNTHQSDVLRRFNPLINDGYVKSEKYLDWNITADFSMAFDTKEQAEAEEQRWLTEVFPNPGPTKVWVEKILQCPTMDYYSEASGITELRLLTKKQRKWALRKLYEMKKEAV
jgi:hypothetical protein